jgi:hypothetical protein
MDVSSLGDRPLEEIAQFAQCKNLAELNDALFDAVQSEVDTMQDLIADADAFDVIELIRLRAMPPVPITALREGFDGSVAAVEIVALLLMARESRKPGTTPRSETRPHEATDELHRRATKLLRLSTFKLQIEGAMRPDEPLARLAAEYQSNNVCVRSMQYASFHDAFNAALLDNQVMDGVMREVLGFTYVEFDTIRYAIQDFYSEKLTGVRDLLGEIAVESNGGQIPQTEARIAQGQRAAIDFLFLPGERASFRAEDIIARTGLDSIQVSSVLNTFSLKFNNPRPGCDLVFDFLRGSNPIARRALLADESGNYVMTSLQIGTDSLRRIVEAALKHTKDWKRYDKVRNEVSERLAIDYLQKVLKTTAQHTNLKYFAPHVGIEPSELDASCVNPTAVAKQTEADGLLLIEDVALCVEVKARSIAEQARRGDIARLTHELEDTIGSAAFQARRLERLIETNHGLWLEDRTWLDLSFVREVRSIAVGLDDYGPLGIMLDELRRANVITDKKLPWFTSIHDLATISAVIDLPAEFLLYVRRRSDSGVSNLYRASDELDLFMLFLNGGLYVEPDPDEVHRLHPATPPPSKHDRRRYTESAQTTRVGTFTDPLDAWIYSKEGNNPFPAEKPTFNANAWVLELVAFLMVGRKCGWFRFAADLLSVAGKSQKELASSVKTIVRQTRADHRPHSLVHAYAGIWGHPAFFAQTQPHGMGRVEAREHLETYMSAKKHQLQSDRALGVLVNEKAEIVHVLYNNEPASADPELDALGQEIGLVPVIGVRRPIPPSAKRHVRRIRRRKPKDRHTN